MNASRRITLTASLLLVFFMAASILIVHRIEVLRSGAALEEVLYISSPRLLKRLGLGYDGLLADIYWTRTVQYFGTKHRAGATSYKLLAPLLEITTALDPQLIVAYEFGGNFLAPRPPYGAGMPQKAIALVERGIQNNPDEWRLYYQLGFIRYMDLNDYAGAARAFLDGSRVPHAHPWLKVLAAQMAQHAGEWETARMLWSTTYSTANDPAIRANAAAHIRALQADRDVIVLEILVAKYQKANGHPPKKLSDLVAAGILRGVPLDPLGHPYRLGQDGHVEVQSPDDLPFIQKGLPPGYVPPVRPKILPSD
ncbi:MAG TPA: hypothetical protein VMH85_03190 [Terriglobales bacterium]|nr:hypothetical protein [Terriglobales bacterium]